MSDPITVQPSILDLLPSSDELLARRASIARELAPLRALYAGNGYMGERMFKLDEAKVAVAIRTRFKEAGEKSTEAQIDALVRNDPDYIAALTRDVQQRERWADLEERLNEVEWRLRCRQSDASLLAAEARLQ